MMQRTPLSDRDIAFYLMATWDSLVGPTWLLRDVRAVGPAIRDGVPLADLDEKIFEQIWPKLATVGRDLAGRCVSHWQGSPTDPTQDDVGAHVRALWSALSEPKWKDDDLTSLGKALFAHVKLKDLDVVVFDRLLPSLSEVASSLAQSSIAHCATKYPPSPRATEEAIQEPLPRTEEAKDDTSQNAGPPTSTIESSPAETTETKEESDAEAHEE